MYSKKQLKLFDYKVLGKLPNLFLFDNGESVKSLEDWNRRREEIYRTAVDIQFGTLPPSLTIQKSNYSLRGNSSGAIRLFVADKTRALAFAKTNTSATKLSDDHRR